MPEVAKVYKNKTHQMEKIILTDEQNELNADGVEWNIERIRANEAWDLGIDGTGAVVGSLDSGVDWTHPALKTNGEDMIQIQEKPIQMETGLIQYILLHYQQIPIAMEPM